MHNSPTALNSFTGTIPQCGVSNLCSKELFGLPSIVVATFWCVVLFLSFGSSFPMIFMKIESSKTNAWFTSHQIYPLHNHPVGNQSVRDLACWSLLSAISGPLPLLWVSQPLREVLSIRDWTSVRYFLGIGMQGGVMSFLFLVFAVLILLFGKQNVECASFAHLPLRKRLLCSEDLKMLLADGKWISVVRLTFPWVRHNSPR